MVEQSIPDCYKNQEMCKTAVDNYPRTHSTAQSFGQFG